MRLSMRLSIVAMASIWTFMNLGCERQSAPTTQRAAVAKPATQPGATDAANVEDFLKEGAAQAEAALPPGHPPIDPAAVAQPLDPRTTLPPAAPKGVQYDVPAGWQSLPPTSSMRAAQYVLPRAEGDTQDGDMVLFFFGAGGGGPVQANIDRWKGMFTTADGQPVGDDGVTLETLEVNDLKVTYLEVVGQYNASTMPGVGEAAPLKSDFRMLAAIVEGPGGPWFFKGVGPDATMAAQRENFKKLLQSLHH